MNDLQIFQNDEFGKIRTIEENGNILFCGSDIALALGYNQPHKAIKQHCKNGGMFYTVIDSMGRKQKARFINEPDFYRLICNSKLSTAKKFEKWVFEEVLPTIRKTGSYTSQNNNSSKVRETSLIVAEIVNAMISVITKSIIDVQQRTSFKGSEKNETAKTVISIKPTRRSRATACFKLQNFPEEVYETAVRMLENGATFQNVADYCNSKGYEISSMSICRYYHAFLED